MRIDVAVDIFPSSIWFDRSQQTRRRQGRNKLTIGLEARGDGKSSYEMTDDVKRYWFVVAVFRDPLDLATTVAELHASNFVSGELLVLANHRAGDVRKAIYGRNGGFIDVFVPRANGCIESKESPALPPSLSMLLHAMAEGAPSTRSPSGSDDGQVPSPIYSQLLKNVADGAIVLIASANGPEQQLQGARILLRGKCECVLTHEFTKRGS
ncbi:MAG: hypothetical protein ACR2OF_08865 [Hyphomicrobium sp.]